MHAAFKALFEPEGDLDLSPSIYSCIDSDCSQCCLQTNSSKIKQSPLKQIEVDSGLTNVVGPV